MTDPQAGSGDRDAPGEGSPGGAPAFALSPQRTQKAEIVPLGAQRYKMQFMASAATHDKLRRAQELLRHRIPGGDVGAVIDQALDLLVHDLEKKKFAAADRPRRVEKSAGESSPSEGRAGNASEGRAASPAPASPSRAVPAQVKREVWQRDQGRCAFTSPSGARCTERGLLEFDHIRPFADGGAATVDNVRLLCRQHNQYEALQFFGPWENDGCTA